MAEIITIPAVDKNSLLRRKKRVAAYCRVSSFSQEQATSLLNQTIYYKNLIKQNKEWDFCGIYPDKGITGTHKDRKEFQRLISDCKKGKIDIVLTKSISRFARNIIDCLNIVEELRNYGVSVFFERDNINTSSHDDDMMLSILGSCAEQESISISSNLKTGVRNRMENGLYRPAKFAYGYKASKEYFMELDPERSKITLRILTEYESKGYEAIARELNNEHIPCNGKKWTASVIRYIVKNERNIGDALLQKTYSANTFPFEKRKNKGEVQQIYYSNSHPRIICKDQYDKNNKITEYERYMNNINSEGSQNRYAFSGKIYCNKCGAKFKRRVIHRKTVTWACCNHLQSKDLCSVKAVKDIVIKKDFMNMCGKLKTNADILDSIILAYKKYKYSIHIDYEKINVMNKINEITEQSQTLGNEYNAGLIDFALFLQQQEELDLKLRHYQNELKELSADEENDLKLSTERIQKALQNEDVNNEFNEYLFETIIDKVIIFEDGSTEFILTNGMYCRELRGSDLNGY